MKRYEIYSWVDDACKNFAMIEAETAPQHPFTEFAQRIACFEASSWEDARAVYDDVLDEPLHIRAID